MNLLRGAGLRGASGMRGSRGLEGKLLARPLLEVSRARIEEYGRAHDLEWIEDESNADEALTRNFLRRRVGPLLETRFPDWKRALARAARLAAEKDDRAGRLLREFLSSQGLKAPSEAKLVEMLKQLTSGAARTRLEHDGATVRVYRGRVSLDATPAGAFAPLPWKGERRLKIPALGGELRFTAGEGVASEHLKKGPFQVRLRCRWRAPAGSSAPAADARSRTCSRKRACRRGFASACRCFFAAMTWSGRRASASTCVIRAAVSPRNGSWKKSAFRR
jgi:hypothetical protein